MSMVLKAPLFCPSIGKAIDKISDIGNMMAGIFMFIVSLMICYEAIARHLFNRPTTWVMSVSLFAFMWFPFLSTSYCIKVDKHITCDILIAKLHERAREWLGIFTDLTTLIFIISLGYFGYEYFKEAYQLRSMSVGLVQYPLWVLRIIFPLSMLFCFLQTVRKIFHRIDLLQTQIERGAVGWLNNPKVIVFCYITTTIAGLWIFTINPSLGILMMTLVFIFWGVPIAFALGSVGVIGLITFYGSIAGLNVVPIVLPALRERKNDIPLLVEQFLHQASEQGQKTVGISKEALSIMMDYPWPGNVRELQNAIHFGLVKCKGRAIGAKDLPLEIKERSSRRGPERKLNLETVRAALERTGGNKAKAARHLGVGRATLYRFLAEFPDVS